MRFEGLARRGSWMIIEASVAIGVCAAALGAAVPVNHRAINAAGFATALGLLGFVLLRLGAIVFMHPYAWALLSVGLTVVGGGTFVGLLVGRALRRSAGT